MIDTKLLRQKLIDMAMRGLLVEQRPEDGHATDLLEQIRAEKAALIKAGKIKKEKPLPEIKEEEKPFTIPANWCWVRLGEIGIFKKGPFGSSLTKSMFIPKDGNTIKVYEQKNAIQKDCALGNYYISQEYFESNMRSFEVFPGDIIVSCAGTIGETYLMPENMEKGIINQALMRIKLMTSVHLNYFLTYFDSVLKSSAQKESRGSALKNIPPFDILKKMLVPLPPLAEQKRIVTALESCLKLVDTIAKDSADLDKALKFLRQKMLDMAVRGQLVEQRPEDGNATDLLEQIRAEKAALIKAGKIKKEKPLPEIKEEEKTFTIPANWCWVRLGELCKKVGAGSTPTGGKAVYKDSGPMLLRSQNVYNDGLRLNEVARFDAELWSNRSSHVLPNDLLLNITASALGRSAIVPSLFEDADVNQHVLILRQVVLDTVYYVHKAIISPCVQAAIMRAQVGTTREGLSALNASRLLIPLPPLAEQKRIVAKLEQINALIETMLN